VAGPRDPDEVRRPRHASTVTYTVPNAGVTCHEPPITAPEALGHGPAASPGYVPQPWSRSRTGVTAHAPFANPIKPHAGSVSPRLSPLPVPTTHPAADARLACGSPVALVYRLPDGERCSRQPKALPATVPRPTPAQTDTIQDHTTGARNHNLTSGYGRRVEPVTREHRGGPDRGRGHPRHCVDREQRHDPVPTGPVSIASCVHPGNSGARSTRTCVHAPVGPRPCPTTTLRASRRFLAAASSSSRNGP